MNWKKVITSMSAAAIFSASYVGIGQAQTYTVQSGDSLFKISQQFNTTVTTLKELNQLSSDMIFLNQVLVINEELPQQYTVQTGDSLYKISVKFNVTIENIIEWNSLTTTSIFPGQVLEVTQPSTTTEPVIETQKDQYEVQSGDTLWIIANKSGVTIQQILSWNNLSSDMIYPGQILQVQEPVGIKLVNIAKQYIGTPYVWGGSTTSGFDCSGFIYYVLNEAGISVIRTNTEGYFNMSTTVVTPQVGDFVFFENTYKPGISHMGIYVGDRQFIHASSSKGVTISSIDNVYFQPRFVGYKQLSSN